MIHPVDRIPPQDVHVEQAVLGAMLLSSRGIDAAREALESSDFYDGRHILIFQAILDLDVQSHPVDQMTLTNELRRRSQLSEIGGVSYLAQLASEVATWANVSHHAGIVREKSLLRRIYQITHAIGESVFEGKEEAQPLLQRTEQQLLELAGAHSEGGLVAYEAILTETLEQLERLSANGGQIQGVPSGFPELDQMTAGWQKGDLIVLAARPSMGKAQPLSSKLLTPSGWIPMGEVYVGDLVGGSDGQFYPITGVYPQGKKAVFKVVMRDGAITRCCDEHLWHTRTRQDRVEGRAGAVKPLSELRTRVRTPNGAGYRNNHTIPYVQPINFPPASLPLNPYLLGIYLGDGNSHGCVRIDNPEIDIQHSIESALPSDDILKINGKECTIVRRRRNNQMSNTKQSLIHLGLSGLRSYEKFIPHIYLHSSIEDRTQLLCGLIDSDGYVTDPNGAGVEFVTTSPELRAGLVFLVQSLGGYIRWREIETHYTKNNQRVSCRNAFRVNISFHATAIIPVSSEKHLKKWNGTNRWPERSIVDVVADGEEECQCISIDSPDHLYVTDGFILTHNTALSLAFADAALMAGKRVAYFSLEMASSQLAQRHLCMRTSIDLHRLRSGRLNESEWLHLTRQIGQIAQVPLSIDDRGSLNPLDLRTACRRQKRETGLDLVVVDYLQLMECHVRTQSREQEVAKISRALKQLAKELEVPILALSQLSRALESRTDRRPRLADLRDSGAVEQDADVVMFIYRPEVYGIASLELRDGTQINSENRAELILAKQRNGQIGSTYLRWYPDYTRYEEYPIETHREPVADHWNS